MEVSFQGFSIREYACEMRSVDVRKCWPFGEAESELRSDEIETLLPAMAFRKHVWWLDELPAARLRQSEAEEAEKSGILEKRLGFCEAMEGIEETALVLGSSALDEEAAMKACPVCGIFTARTVNAHIDSCLSNVTKKGRRVMQFARSKSKMPKKRSIVEIFALSPHVVALEEDEKELSTGAEDERSDLGVLKPKRKKNKQEMMAKKKVEVKIKRRNQMSKKSLSKEKYRKSIMPCSLDVSESLQGSSLNTKRTRKPKGVLGIRQRVASKSKISNRNQTKRKRASKSITKLQDDASDVPFKRAPKKRTQSTKVQKLWPKCKLKGTKAIPLEQPDGHTIFSGREKIIGTPKKCCSGLECLQLQSVVEPLSSVVRRPIEGGKAAPGIAEDPGGSEWFQGVEVDGSDSRSSERKQGGDVYLSMQLPSFGYSVDVNQAFRSHYNLPLPNVLPTQILSEHQGTVNGEPQIERCVSLKLTSTRNQPDAFASQTLIRSVSSRDSGSKNAYSQDAFSPLLMNVNKSQNQTSHHQEAGLNSLLRENVSPTSVQLGRPRLDANPTSLCIDKPSETFAGLPLNSQGELVKLHAGLDELSKKQSLMTSSFGCFPVNIPDYCREQRLNGRVAQMPGHSLNPVLRVSSGLAMTNFQDPGRPASVLPEISLMDLSNQWFRGYNRLVESYKDCAIIRERGQPDTDSQPPNQPTVRLMGKNITLGRNNPEGEVQEIGKMWTEKEIITEEFLPLVNLSDKAMLRQSLHSLPSISKRTETHSLEALSTPNAPLSFPMRRSGRDFSHSHLNCVPYQMSRSCRPPMNEAIGMELQSLHPWKLLEKCISGTKSVAVGSQKQLAGSQVHTSLPQRMFRFPCANQEYVAFQYDEAQCSSPSLPRWLPSATQQDTEYMALSGPPHFISKQNDGVTPGSFVPYPALYNPSGLSFHSYNPSTSLSSPDTSSVFPSLVQAVPAHEFTQEIGVRRENDRSLVGKLKSTGYCDHSETVKKRPASRVQDSINSPKRLNLLQQGASETERNLNRRDQVAHNLHDSGTYKDQILELNFSGLETESKVRGKSLGTCSSEPDNISRVGPIKLSAGAKHVLKPSQRIHQDKSRPIHATIPFTGISDSGKLPGFGRKTTKIYRF